LHNCRIAPNLGKGAHVHEVARGKSLDFRECSAQVTRQPFDDLAAPSLLGLLLKNVPTDLPVELDQLGVGGQRGALTRGHRSRLDVRQPLGVVGRGRQRFPAHGATSPAASLWKSELR